MMTTEAGRSKFMIRQVRRQVQLHETTRGMAFLEKFLIATCPRMMVMVCK